MDAARTLPVAAAPIMAPVAAPHAAPCPTGVSHEFRRRKPSEITETIGRTFVFIESLSSSNEPHADTVVARQCAIPTNRCVIWMLGRPVVRHFELTSLVNLSVYVSPIMADQSGPIQ